MNKHRGSNFEEFLKEEGILEVGEKELLLNLMNSLDFSIADITYINGQELVAKKMIESNAVVWWEMEREGSGFVQLFKGAIKKACETK